MNRLTEPPNGGSLCPSPRSDTAGLCAASVRRRISRHANSLLTGINALCRLYADSGEYGRFLAETDQIKAIASGIAALYRDGGSPCIAAPPRSYAASRAASGTKKTAAELLLRILTDAAALAALVGIRRVERELVLSSRVFLSQLEYALSANAARRKR